MEEIRIEHLNFIYAGTSRKVLCDVSMHIRGGEFVCICGPSGCGKSTLLRQLKPAVTPGGLQTGRILYDGQLQNGSSQQTDDRLQASKIGFVHQSPDRQIVSEKVWHELAFGLENLGFPMETIHRRIAEIADFFGMESWFHKNVNELSGGQKQILNLASVMAMYPEILVLDEPTSQLDPIAAREFLDCLVRINREFGTAILLTEHRLEDVLPVCNRLYVMDQGKIVCSGSVQEAGSYLQKNRKDLFLSMPSAMRIWAELTGSAAEKLIEKSDRYRNDDDNCKNRTDDDKCQNRDGDDKRRNRDGGEKCRDRDGGDKYKEEGALCPVTPVQGHRWLKRYLEDKGGTLPVSYQEDLSERNTDSRQTPLLFAQDLYFRYEKNGRDILRGVSFLLYPGTMLAVVGANGAGKSTLLSIIGGIRKPYKGSLEKAGRTGMLPQRPEMLFVTKTVHGELEDAAENCPGTKEESIRKMTGLCRLQGLENRHPYDLSGGEMQRLALAKVLLTDPDILILDEPTKGMDADFKTGFAEILFELKRRGKVILMVSHDMEFCACCADSCAMLFDGELVCQEKTQQFFSDNRFYTTAARRISRGIIESAVTVDQILQACGQANQKEPDPKDPAQADAEADQAGSRQTDTELSRAGQAPMVEQSDKAAAGQVKSNPAEVPAKYLPYLLLILAVPVTLAVGELLFHERKYLFISLLIILEVLAAFAFSYETKKPRARDLVVVSVLCALTVAGRAAFYMFPQVKPVIAMVVISAVSLGPETGFLVGAMSMLVSNAFFSQGAWTPWQMFAMGLIGFAAGLLHKAKILPGKRIPMCIFGFLSAIFIYGLIMNPASAIMSGADLTMNVLMLYYASGFPMDLIQAIATAVFLFLLAEPMLEKLERVKKI